MKCKEPGTRACIAYLVGRMVSGTACSGVHDHDRGLDARIGGTVRGSRVGLYDYDRKCNVFGRLPDLQGEATEIRISLIIEEDRFNGRDSASGQCFSGTVKGREIIFTADSVPPWMGRYTLQVAGASLSGVWRTLKQAVWRAGYHEWRWRGTRHCRAFSVTPSRRMPSILAIFAWVIMSSLLGSLSRLRGNHLHNCWSSK